MSPLFTTATPPRPNRIAIRPFALPTVRELPPRHAAAGSAW